MKANHFYRPDHSKHVDVSGMLALLRDATGAETGDPWNALTDAVQTAHAVRAASVGHERFNGAEVDLAVAREIRAVSDAALTAAANLRRMRAFLTGEE